jgi:hypothetical protein
VPKAFDQKSWRWDEEKKGLNCVINGSKVNGMSKSRTNCFLAPSFRADETRTIKLRYLLASYDSYLELYNVQVVDVATRLKNHKGFDN